MGSSREAPARSIDDCFLGRSFAKALAWLGSALLSLVCFLSCSSLLKVATVLRDGARVCYHSTKLTAILTKFQPFFLPKYSLCCASFCLISRVLKKFSLFLLLVWLFLWKGEHWEVLASRFFASIPSWPVFCEGASLPSLPRGRWS